MKYDEGAAMVDKVVEAMIEGGLPKQDVPLLFADYAVITGLLASGPAGVEAVVERIERLALQAERGKFGAEFMTPSHSPRRKRMGRNAPAA
jgi:hypothetical protein